MKRDPNRCPKCGKKDSLRPGTKAADRLLVSNYYFDGELPAIVCNNCGLTSVELKCIGTFQLGVAKIFAEAGYLSPRAFKFMREVLDMQTTDLADLLDVTPETISWWEASGGNNNDWGCLTPEEKRLSSLPFALLSGMVMDRLNGCDDTVKRQRAVHSPMTQLEERRAIPFRDVTIRTDMSEGIRKVIDLWQKAHTTTDK